MRKLPAIRKKNGCFYKQVCRSDRTAMYSLSYTDGGEIIAYAVFKIRVDDAFVLHGVEVPEQEHFPCNEDFGKIAWSYTTREFAQVKYDELERRPS
jgi:hypothetical protein